MATTIDRSAIESNLNTVLSADSWLGSADPVRVNLFQAGLPPRYDAANASTFGITKFPAVVSFVRDILGDEIRSARSAFGEYINHVPCAVLILDVKATAAAALTAAVDIREQAERVVRKQRTSTKKWNGSGHTDPDSIRAGVSILPHGSSNWCVIAEVLLDLIAFTDMET